MRRLIGGEDPDMKLMKRRQGQCSGYKICTKELDQGMILWRTYI